MVCLVMRAARTIHCWAFLYEHSLVLDAGKRAPSYVAKSSCSCYKYCHTLFGDVWVGDLKPSCAWPICKELFRKSPSPASSTIHSIVHRKKYNCVARAVHIQLRRLLLNVSFASIQGIWLPPCASHERIRFPHPKFHDLGCVRFPWKDPSLRPRGRLILVFQDQ